MKKKYKCAAEFTNFWKEVVSSGEMPSRCTGVTSVQYDEFAREINEGNVDYFASLAEKLKLGQVLILKEALSKNITEKIKSETVTFWNSQPSEFFKMLEDCPNFHRVIDEETSKNYSVKAVRHSAYVFPWNDDYLGVRKKINDCWRVIKKFSGLSPLMFEENTPKTGVVDRIQVCLYPPGVGVLETHTDPFHNSLFFINVHLTTRGEKGGFTEGGLYAIGANEETLDIEPFVQEGDITIGLPTVQHGVLQVDPSYSGPIDWYGSRGRWFLGLYSNDSDEVSKRKTASPIKT
jgi:hypothetical protein